jgi:hypothetical protein
MRGDLLDFVRCWCPIGDRISVASTGHQRDRGACGHLDAWVARRGQRYAVVWVDVSTGLLTGARGNRVSSFGRGPDAILDHEAISAIATWISRAEAIAELRR